MQAPAGRSKHLVPHSTHQGHPIQHQVSCIACGTLQDCTRELAWQCKYVSAVAGMISISHNRVACYSFNVCRCASAGSAGCGSLVSILCGCLFRKRLSCHTTAANTSARAATLGQTGTSRLVSSLACFHHRCFFPLQSIRKYENINMKI